MEILKFQPVGKDYLWGGERFKTEFGKIDLTPLSLYVGMLSSSRR